MRLAAGGSSHPSSSQPSSSIRCKIGYKTPTASLRPFQAATVRRVGREPGPYAVSGTIPKLRHVCCLRSRESEVLPKVRCECAGIGCDRADDPANVLDGQITQSHQSLRHFCRALMPEPHTSTFTREEVAVGQ